MLSTPKLYLLYPTLSNYVTPSTNFEKSYVGNF